MTQKSKRVGFWEEPDIIKIIDGIAQSRGIDRSDYIRETLRERLREQGHLPDPCSPIESTRG